MVSQVTQKGSLAHPRLAVELDWLGGSQGGSRGSNLGFPVQQAGQLGRAQEDRRGTSLHVGLLRRRGDMDHATVDGTDLKDVISDGYLAADPSPANCHLPTPIYQRRAGQTKKITDIIQKKAHATSA